MSYSVNVPCYQCIKKDTCTDYKKITKTVQEDIHQTPYDNGHQGSGTIVLMCIKMESTIK